MTLTGLLRPLPSWQNALLAALSAGLLILAFPPFELWYIAWFALVPLFRAIEQEGESPARSFGVGWVFGNIFFFGTCWWLTFAPITYAGFPAPLAYLLFLAVTSVAAVFTGFFGAILRFLLNRFGSAAFLAAPFVWVFAEFIRFWITGNDWNALGYSQFVHTVTVGYAAAGGVLLVSFLPAVVSALICLWLTRPARYFLFVLAAAFFFLFTQVELGVLHNSPTARGKGSRVVAIQPNVPMSGLTLEKWQELRLRHVRLAEAALTGAEFRENSTVEKRDVTVVFPESPMNFMYEDEAETQEFINGFAAKHDVSVLFNSAEPDASSGKYFNSAVLVGPEGREVVQYDKIFLLPFGEAVPFPLGAVMPGFVGTFSYGKEYDLFPLGDAKAGVMICFESHFGQLSRRYVQDGADAIVEMTNDGYLGPTPVLRQHLANAVFRAVETNRPVLRVTNVGITAYVNERGEVLDEAEPYTEATRIWTVAKSDGSQTFYVRYGDWFAWPCSIITIGLLVFGIVGGRRVGPYRPTKRGW